MKVVFKLVEEEGENDANGAAEHCTAIVSTMGGRVWRVCRMGGVDVCGSNAQTSDNIKMYVYCTYPDPCASGKLYLCVKWKWL